MTLIDKAKVLSVFDENIQYCDGQRERAFVTNLRETIAALDSEEKRTITCPYCKKVVGEL